MHRYRSCQKNSACNLKSLFYIFPIQGILFKKLGVLRGREGKGMRRGLGAGAVGRTAANSENLGKFLRLSSKLCQRVPDEKSHHLRQKSLVRGQQGHC